MEAAQLDQENPCKWRPYAPAIILLCVRWYLRYSLSYRDLAEILAERGLPVDHTPIYRPFQRYAPALDKRVRRHLESTNDSWRVDATYIKVHGEWAYLYRAVDSAGNTRDLVLSPYRDARSADYFFRKLLGAAHPVAPRVIVQRCVAHQWGRQRRLSRGVPGAAGEGRAGGGGRVAAREISEPHNRAGSPLHQAQSETRLRVCLVQNNMGHVTGLRSHEPGTKGASRGHTQRGY